MTREALGKAIAILQDLDKARAVEEYIKRKVIDSDHPIAITAGNNRGEVVAFDRLRDCLAYSILDGIERLRDELNKEFEEL